MITPPVLARAERYIEAYQVLARDFVWDHHLVKQFGALTFVQKVPQGLPDVAKIHEVKKYIKDKTGIFSSFRGMNALMTSLLVYLSEKQEAYFDESLEVFRALKEAGFAAGSYLPLAAMTIAQSCSESDPSQHQKIARMQQFYKGFKSHHFWLTSQDDYVYAALLACTPNSVEPMIDQIETMYRDLSEGGIYKGNGLQSLTHVLALGEQPLNIKVSKALSIYATLNQSGYRLNQYHLAFIGVLCLITDQPQPLLEESIALEGWLKKQKGFGGLSVDKKTRFVIAASICIQEYVEASDFNKTAVLANSLQAIMIAEQIAITAAIIAASAASSSAASS